MDLAPRVGARPGRVPLGLGPVDEVLEALEAEQVLGRLDAHAHLVPVVGARVRQAVHDGTDRRTQDQVIEGDLLGAIEVALEAVDGVPHTRHRRLQR